MSNTTNPFAQRRQGVYFRYFVDAVDSTHIAIIEYDNGRLTPPNPPTPDGLREPSRRLAVLHIKRLEEAEAWVAQWNAENDEKERYLNQRAPMERLAKMDRRG